VNLDRVLEALQAACPSADLAIQRAPVDECIVTLPPTHIRDAVAALLELDVYHLSTITGQDLDGEIVLLYHFWEGSGLTLRVSLPRDEARITSVTELIPGAQFYEREIAEMLHVTVEGHPDPRPFLLPDDWNGEAPLRQEFTLERGDDS
jgi:NADH:ubiquinone oxidoreductase subunit C